MQKDHNDASPPHRSSISHQEAPNDRFARSAKSRDKLEELARWRIEPSLIEFSKAALDFTGGNATVSRAFLILQSDHKIRMESDGQTIECEGKDAQKSGAQSLERKAVAVKKMKIKKYKGVEHVLRLALRESEFLLKLSHPNIVKLEGFVEDVSRTVVWLIFPWEENGNLRDFLVSGDWEIPERISLIDDVTKGVEYLHNQEPPICHGDLKSLNILVDSKHHAVITDFGSARRLTKRSLGDKSILNNMDRSPEGDPTSQENIPFRAEFCAATNTITITGDNYTIRWAAPELLKHNQSSLESDIWALGWIAYEVMTNSIPFHDVKMDMNVVRHIIYGNLPLITEDVRVSVNQALCSLMAKCWSRDPTKRPTAEDCRKSISWMPKIVPTPTRAIDAGVSRVRHSELLIKLGEMYKQRADHFNATKSFTSALDICADGGSSQGRADALYGLADVHRIRDEYAEAVTFYSEALQICTDIGYQTRGARCLWGLGEVHRLRGGYIEAITSYTEALQVCTDVNYREGRALALWGLAEVHRLQYEYSKAVPFYSEALLICTDIGAQRGRADAMWGLAMVHQLRDEYSEAMKLYSEALQICEGVGNQNGTANALCGLAEVYQLQNNHSKAIALYSKALQIRTNIGDNQGKADVLWGLAELHQLQNNYDQAAELYSGALQIYTDIGSQIGRADALLGLATILRLQSKHSEAAALYSQALQTCNDIGSGHSGARALLGLAEIHCDQEHRSDAMSLYVEAVEILERIGDAEGVAVTLNEAANVLRRLEGAA